MIRSIQIKHGYKYCCDLQVELVEESPPVTAVAQKDRHSKEAELVTEF